MSHWGGKWHPTLLALMERCQQSVSSPCHQGLWSLQTASSVGQQDQRVILWRLSENESCLGSIKESQRALVNIILICSIVCIILLMLFSSNVLFHYLRVFLKMWFIQDSIILYASGSQTGVRATSEGSWMLSRELHEYNSLGDITTTKVIWC